MSHSRNTSPVSEREGLKALLNSDQKRSQFLRFCINGCISTAMQYAIYWLLLPLMNASIALTVGYVLSFLYNFVVTSYWTFHSRPSWKRLTGFGGSHVINYFVQLAFLNLYIFLGMPEEWAGIIAMGSAVPVNFMLVKWVYKH